MFIISFIKKGQDLNRIITSVFIMSMALVSYNFFDLPVATYFQNLKGNRLYEFFHFLTEFGKAEYFLLPAAAFYFYYKKRDISKSLKAGFVFVSVALSGIIVLLIKMIGGRFRPEMYFKEEAFGFDFFHISHTMTSFPSGHSATALGGAAALALLFSKYRVPFYLFGIAIMISRVIVVRHFPSDIMIGALIGALTSYILYERYFQKAILDAK